MSLAEIRHRKRERILDDVRNRLRVLGLVPPHVMPVLFGSLARGDWDGRSDVDLALLIEGPEDAISESLSALFKDPGTSRGADIVVIRNADLERCGIRDAIRSGEPLFPDDPSP
jgi:predicted nucleotidyltransferase